MRLAFGGRLALDFAGTDTIRSLFFDGRLQQLGTHGAPGSGADHSHDTFSGTGTLTVTAGVPVKGAILMLR